MASTVLLIDAIEEMAPVLLKLSATTGATGTPNPAGYSLTATSEAWSYTATVPEALIGIFRAVAEDTDGLTVGVGYIWIVADDVGPYIVAADMAGARQLEAIGVFESGMVDLAAALEAGLNISILPGFFLNQRRNVANAIELYTGETGDFVTPVLDANRDPLDLTAMTLEMRFCKADGTSHVVIADGDLDKSTVGQIGWTATTPLTAVAVTNGTFALRDMSNGANVVVKGKFTVTGVC